MKIYQPLIVAFAALLFISCGGAATNNTAPPIAVSSPTEVLKIYIEASERKDLAAVKQTFSKGTLSMYEDAAKSKQISVDEVISQQFEAASANGQSRIQPGKETITGDTAIVEAKDSQTGGTEQIPLVKEDGAWKLAFDKYMESLMERMREQMKMPAPNLPKTENSNKPAGNK